MSCLWNYLHQSAKIESFKCKNGCMFNLPEGHRDIKNITENIMAVASLWYCVLGPFSQCNFRKVLSKFVREDVVINGKYNSLQASNQSNTELFLINFLNIGKIVFPRKPLTKYGGTLYPGFPSEWGPVKRKYTYGQGGQFFSDIAPRFYEYHLQFVIIYL